jgi:hypothetical protein
VSAATVESDGYRHLLDGKGLIEGQKAKARLDGSRAFFVSISSIAVLAKFSAKRREHMAHSNRSAIHVFNVVRVHRDGGSAAGWPIKVSLFTLDEPFRGETCKSASLPNQIRRGGTFSLVRVSAYFVL